MDMYFQDKQQCLSFFYAKKILLVIIMKRWDNYSMNYIFFLLVGIAIIYGIINGRAEAITNAMFDGANLAVKIAFSLIGIMAFWLGVMRVAEKSGFAEFLAKLLTPIIKILFNDIPKNHPVNANITMSVTANALGLTNAATPIGLKVMDDLQKLNDQKDTATDSMCLFLAMNTAGFQIIPATVLAVLVGVGASKPSEIILPTLIVTSIAFFSAIIIAKGFAKIWNRRKW